MNQVKGALYIAGCHGEPYCFWPTIIDPETEVDDEKVYNITHFLLEFDVVYPQ